MTICFVFTYNVCLSHLLMPKQPVVDSFVNCMKDVTSSLSSFLPWDPATMWTIDPSPNRWHECFRYSNNISTQTHFGVSFPPLQGYASSDHISYLQFEDDTLLLGSGNLKEAKATNNVIKIFKRPTGKTIWHQQRQINYFFPECKPGTEEKNTEDDGI